mmetsp:Transcript_6757/g.17214  ORF Transcript_6757/g.17214 Transcript_6757/m.17214 type:complete len:210 (+) Transcript_6757:108-737(+)
MAFARPTPRSQPRLPHSRVSESCHASLASSQVTGSTLNRSKGGSVIAFGFCTSLSSGPTMSSSFDVNDSAVSFSITCTLQMLLVTASCSREGNLWHHASRSAEVRSPVPVKYPSSRGIRILNCDRQSGSCAFVVLANSSMQSSVVPSTMLVRITVSGPFACRTDRASRISALVFTFNSVSSSSSKWFGVTMVAKGTTFSLKIGTSSGLA